MEWTQEKRKLFAKMLRSLKKEGEDAFIGKLNINQMVDVAEVTVLKLADRLTRTGTIDTELWRSLEKVVERGSKYGLPGILGISYPIGPSHMYAGPVNFAIRQRSTVGSKKRRFERLLKDILEAHSNEARRIFIQKLVGKIFW